MTKYRIVRVDTEKTQRFKVQKRVLYFFWRDMKRYSGIFSVELGPHFITAWFDTINEARDAIDYDIQQKMKHQVKTTIVEEF